MPKRSGSVFLAMLPIGAFAGLLIAVVITWLIPKIYESEAIIEIKPTIEHLNTQSFPIPIQEPTLADKLAEHIGIDLSKRNHRSPEDVLRNAFLEGELHSIKGPSNIEGVVERLNLTQRWNMDKEKASQTIQGIIDVRIVPGTDLVSISLRSTSKVDARDIVTELVQTYKKDWDEDDRRRSKPKIREQEEKVEERRKLLDTIVRTKDLNIKAISSNTLMHLDQDYVDAKRDYEIDKHILETMKLMADSIANKVPAETVVIRQQPVIADSSVSPNVTLNLVCGTILGLLFLPLMSLPVTRFIASRSPQ
jgi:uncharacterized protein involved in exopolysaccharide biosynthesis